MTNTMQYNYEFCGLPGDITQKGYDKKRSRILASYNGGPSDSRGMKITSENSGRIISSYVHTIRVYALEVATNSHYKNIVIVFIVMLGLCVN